MSKAKENGAYILDVESTGLDVYHDILVGICLYTPDMPSAYVPFNHTDLENKRVEGQMTEEECKAVMLPCLADTELKCLMIKCLLLAGGRGSLMFSGIRK